ncbi:aldo/keto reductase [Desulfomonile tiedjei]|uniref:Putative oxidoreductase of aldo/keto reductase family n=1 Tax=Desulfomonile tiedjei (strain ATCC 49306 / DSM 6799 / DCB-1) TaxID=706587 RepID=I4CDM0_DESTA|nr:aldo/keto reductase [Desulfomonile tiedjei]AFM27661.1 putative oxidoreductase of aldo/keto reductase family [Desulfomonile tiedjei DSM 6799]
MSIEQRPLGKTGRNVTIMGLGGEGILRTYGFEKQAYSLINAAIDMGINYFESARAYSGSESYYGQALRERRRDIFLTSKSHSREKDGALAHLEQTLKNMRTDYLDLWQIHDVRSNEDVDEILGTDGALEAFEAARNKGMVRFVGLTGHQDPQQLLECMDLFDFDTVLIPVNPAEPTYDSFISQVIPRAQENGTAVIGMKVYFRGFAKQLPWYSSMEPFFRYALSQPISTAVIGCDTLRQLEENVTFAQNFVPMTQEEMDKLVEQTAPYARDLMYYKP